MDQKKRILSIFCAIMVMVLCSVNMTYAWQNLAQTAINVNMGERAENKPGGDDTDDPGNNGNPDNPDNPDHPGTDAPGTDDGGRDDVDGQPGTDKEPQSPSGTTADQGTTNGTGDMKTGDTAEFLGYLVLMLVSFVIIIVVGAMLIVLLINEIEKRRKA